MSNRRLDAIAHNVAASMASGLGFLIGYYDMDVFGEAEASSTGVIEVDFLNGKITEGQSSASLAKAATLYVEALPAFCKQHRVDVLNFRELSARFTQEPLGPTFSVTVTNVAGRTVTTDYYGVAGKRARILDSLGRIRPKPAKITRMAEA